MSDQFLGEIRMFAGSYAPQGWALCQGQLMSISQNTGLFSLLGTNYGGDGRATFALPNLQGNVPLNQGQGIGLSQYLIGQISGEANHTLTTQEMPVHSHPLNADSQNNTTTAPGGHLFGKSASRAQLLYGSDSNRTTMAGGVVGVAGSSQPHSNQQPYLVLNFAIALQGIFPPRQ